MKKRLQNKRSKQLTSFALVCERIAGNVVERVSEALRMQKNLDEYDRFLGDLLIMLVKRKPQMVIEHSVPGDDKMASVWKMACSLIKENAELRGQDKGGN